MPGIPEGQLELFDVAGQQAAGGRRSGLGRFAVELRPDQFVIVGIIGLIGLTVIFACGVERGKQLARAERALLVTQQPIVQPAAPVSSTPQSSAAQQAPTANEDAAPALKLAPASEGAPKVKPPAKPVTARSRYAVQVVTYTRPQLAQRELKRLQADGEAAFLVTMHGNTKVYVGPFGSKDSAKEKSGTLRSRYRDCFVKSL